MVKKKKLCIITPAHWSHRMGGSEYQVKLLADNILTQDNFQLIYLSRRIGNSYKPQHYDLIKISGEDICHRCGYFISALNLLKLLKKIKPDIIYQRVGCVYTGIAVFYAKKAGCKMVWHISHDRTLSFEQKWSDIKPSIFIEKKILEWGIKNAPIIIAQSQYQKNLVEKINTKAEIHLVPNFHPMPWKNTINYKSDQIVWIANIKRFKCPEKYIELTEDLKKNGIKTQCIMIGAPADYPNGYQKTIEDRLKKSGNIKYLGKLSQDKVNEIIAQSKLLINTSKWEGFPNTFIQAWMRKTPVVTLNCDPDHIIHNYKCGLVSGTMEKMFKDVVFLLNNEQKRNVMGNNAQNYAFENHSMKNLDKLKKIFIGPV